MWIILLAFACTSVLLAWLLCGHIVWLRFKGDPAQRDVPQPRDFPLISVIVPCFNESELIAEKLRNLFASDYPSDRLDVIVVDGGSTDGTAGIVAKLAADHPNLRLIESPRKGKIHQLNCALGHTQSELVVVTDTDARLGSDTLGWIVAEFQTDRDTAAVGACTTPYEGLPVERCYWAAQNRVRLLESAAGHVTIVAACCYAFRRSLIAQFPEDVIADDVFTVVTANTAGFKTRYSAKAVVQELRTPSTLTEFFQHKFRKSNAVLRELLRVNYRLPEMVSPWKSILLTSLLQQLLLPWLSALWVVLAAALVNLGQFDFVGLTVAGLLLSLLAARKVAAGVDLPPTAQDRFNPVTLTLAYAYTMVVLCATALSYTFFTQTTQYRRIGQSAAQAPPTGHDDAQDEPAVVSGGAPHPPEPVLSSLGAAAS